MRLLFVFIQHPTETEKMKGELALPESLLSLRGADTRRSRSARQQLGTQSVPSLGMLNSYKNR